MTRQLFQPSVVGLIFAVVIMGRIGCTKAKHTAGPKGQITVTSAAAAAAINSSTGEPGWQTYMHSSTAPATASGQHHTAAVTRRVRLGRETLPEFGRSFQDLTLQSTPETAGRLHVKVHPTGEQRWEVPESIVPRPAAAPGLSPGSLLYAVTTQPEGSEAFALKVTRQNGSPIFDTTGHRFVFKDQYIELTTQLPPDADLYGLGEVTLPTGLRLPRNGTVITLWNRDLSASEPHVNLYSSHAFYLQVNSDGAAHGVFFLNSNGMDVLLNRTSLTYRVIGGLVDLYFFLGPTPEEVIRQYHQVIGAPVMPPYWALGAHQGKWGYSNVSVLEQVVANYSSATLPLECMWVDIEYMANRFQTMTFDEARFPVAAMRSFVDKLHAVGQKWVPIQDTGIAVAKGYKAYEEGVRDDVFIKDHKGDPYLGQVWPGEVYYPDYLSSPNVTSWLQRQLKYMHDQVPFDGLWLDMSEASNFCSGMTCKPDAANKKAMHWLTLATPSNYDLSAFIQPRTTCQMQCEQAPRTNKLAHPPYSIHNFDAKGRMRRAGISSKIIHPTARHADGSLEYDAHSLFGTAMAARHYEAYTAMTGQRPFMILRSTFPGAGRWTGHWTGDNRATWQGFFESIASTLNPQFWGMPMSGPDICGFIDTAKASAEAMGFVGMASHGAKGSSTAALPNEEYEELCNRWTAAGAFYPYSRNHMGYFTRDHEPYRWPSVAAAAKKAYGLRYQLLTYLYGELFLAHIRGGTLARPLLFADPADLLARNATGQWMMGEALLVSPVLAPNTTSISPHFTAGAWYSAWDYSRVQLSKGAAAKLEVPLGDVAVHYRGGAIIPWQPAGANALVTRDVRYSPVTLLVTLPSMTADARHMATVAAAAAAGTTKRAAEQTTGAGSLQPYANEEVCAAAYNAPANARKLVSCGLLYMDADTLEVSPNNTVQVWYTAVTDPGALSGTITNTVKANAGQAAGRLTIQAIHILGVPLAAASGHAVGSNGFRPGATVNGQSASAGYDKAREALVISNLSVDVGTDLVVSWQL